MKKTVVFICILTLLVIGTYLVINNKTKAGKEVSYITASWTYSYADVEELSKASDLIALIRVNKSTNNSVINKIPFSTFEVEVIEPVYGCNKGEVISIFMTGGQIENKKIEVIDDPLLKTGQEFLIFSRKNEDGTYTILSGSQGRLAYKDGKLNSLNYINNDIGDNSINIKNEELETVINHVIEVKEKQSE